MTNEEKLFKLLGECKLHRDRSVMNYPTETLIPVFEALIESLGTLNVIAEFSTGCPDSIEAKLARKNLRYINKVLDEIEL